VAKTEIVPNFMDLGGNVAAPLVIVKGFKAIEKCISYPVESLVIKLSNGSRRKTVYHQINRV